MPKKNTSEQEIVELKEEIKSEPKGLVVCAPFSLLRNFQEVKYETGDSFSIPEGWERDIEFENFSKIDRKNSDAPRMAFSVPSPVLDEKGKLKYMETKRVLLPLKEA